MRRYAKYKDSGVEWIGDIPEGWGVVRLQYILKIEKGKLPNNLMQDDFLGGFPYLSMEVLRGAEPTQFSNDTKIIKVSKGDIGILWDGSNSGEVLKININGILSSTVALLSLIDKRMIADFIYYLLKYYEINFKNNTVGMGIPHMNGNYLKETKLLLPPLKEQHQIVAFLDEKTSHIDKLLDISKRKIGLLKEQRASIINQVITKGLNPNAKMKHSGVEWIGDIPEGWALKKLKYVSENLNFKRIPIEVGEREKMKEKKYDYYGATGVIDKVENFIFNETTILVAEDGANLKMRNIKLVYIATGKYWVNNHSHIIKTSTMNIKYLAECLELIDYNPVLTGSAQPKLTKDAIMSVLVIVPPLKEQEQIVAYLDEKTSIIDKSISFEERRIELLKEYRLSIISQVITGKIKVIADE